MQPILVALVRGVGEVGTIRTDREVCHLERAGGERHAPPPPVAGSEYSCSQPVFSHGKMSRPSCSPEQVGVRKRRVKDAARALVRPSRFFVPARFATSATQIDQGCPLRRDTNSGSLSDGTRMKAICAPLAEKTGDVS